MDRRIPVVALILFSCLSVLILSCAAPPSPTTPAEIVLTDQMGRTVRMDKIPRRIISLAPSNTELLFALGLSDRVVGVTSYDDYPQEARQKPVIGGFSTPDIEKIVSQSPDLILAANIHAAEIIPRLEQRGFTVLGLNPVSVSDIFQALTLVGKITGQETPAAGIVSGMQAQIKTITDITDRLPDSQRPRTLYLTWSDPLYTVGAGNLDDDIIRLAGGANITHSLKGTATVTLEEVVRDNPQVIIAGTGMGTGGNAAFQFALTEPRLSMTDARRYNRVYSVDLAVAGRAGPRITGVLQQFTEFIHPELFPPSSPP